MSVGLLDIVGASAPATVEVRGAELEITGVSIGAIARALRGFPELGKFLVGDGVDATVDIAGIVAMVPQAVSELIAAGTGHPEDEEFIKAADTLNASEQVDVLEKILAVTFPKGIGPFVERLAKALEQVSTDVQNTKGKAISSRPQSRSSVPQGTSSKPS